MIEKMVHKILVSGRKSFFVRDMEKDFHTDRGFIRKEELQSAKPGDCLKSNTGHEFCVFEPFFIDCYRKIKRGAQIIPAKDIGCIISETGLNRDSVVLEAGAGSGALSCFLAKICKKVYSYEIREDFYGIVAKNIEFLGITNLALSRRDIYEGISEKNIDVIVLDLPEPWKAISHALTALKVGGFLVSYSPSIPQTMDFVNSLPEGLLHIKTVEILAREWEVSQRKVRPRTQGIGHSGFISFARKIR